MTRTGPDSLRRPVCAPEEGVLLYTADRLAKQETRSMSFFPLLRKPNRNPGKRSRSFVPRLESLEDRTVPSSLTVTNSLDKGPGSLRDTITNAKSGDTIVFAASLDGQTITLTSDQLTINKSLDFEGPGAGLLAISGNDQNRIFNINEGLTLTINGLTLTHGRAVGGNVNGVGGGGAILNVGSVVSLANDVFSQNVSLGSSGNQADGGAIANYTSGSLTVTDSTFLNNRADNSTEGSHWAEGGAIFSERDGPSIVVTGCMFTGNQAIGGSGGVLPFGAFGFGDASGGAIHIEGPASTLRVINSTFTSNEAIAGSGSSAPNGGFAGVYYMDGADGGAIVCHDGGNLVVSGSTFTNNKAIGGSNASGVSIGFAWLGAATGGGIHAQGPTTITNSSFSGNQAIGGNGNSVGSGMILVGGGYGGAIYHDASGALASPLSVSNSTFTSNHAIGGTGNTGGILAGDGIGGGIMVLYGGFGQITAADVGTISGSTFSCNQAIGGGAPGANGADGLGGAIGNLLGSPLTISGCTLNGNQAIGGTGGSGANGGNGFGGGLYNDGTSSLTVTSSTITKNSATGGAAGSGGSAGQGAGGGIYIASGATADLDSYTVAHTTTNTALTDPDLDGRYVLI
jgi:hypothetical protein